MAEKYNAASRVARIYQSAIIHKTQTAAQGGFGRQPNNTVALQVWATVLGVDETGAEAQSFLTMQLLIALREELQIARHVIEATGISPDLVAETFQQATSCLNLSTIGSHAWDSQVQYLTSETVRSLFTYSEFSPADEETPLGADLDLVKAQIEELNNAVEQGNLPDEVKAFFRQHVTILKQAIRKYPISGTRAFHQAFGEAVAVPNRPSTSDKEGKIATVADKLSNIYATVFRRVSDANAIYTLTEHGIKIAALLMGHHPGH